VLQRDAAISEVLMRAFMYRRLELIAHGISDVALMGRCIRRRRCASSLPGVFAVGDVRCGNIKRVAAAVGEGSIAVSFVQRVLAE
jgi:thioredoxin reductase